MYCDEIVANYGFRSQSVAAVGLWGPSFWRTTETNIEQTGENCFTHICPKKYYVDSDASKVSQDEGTN